MAETGFVTGRLIHERALSLWRQALEVKKVIRIAAANIKALNTRERLRDFGAGILATDPALSARAVDQPDSVRMGSPPAQDLLNSLHGHTPVLNRARGLWA